MKTNSLLCLGSFSWPLVQAGMLVVLAVGVLAPPATWATDRHWSGAASANWSNPNNWSPLGAPQTGDILNFGDGGNANTAMFNDVPNLTGIVLRFWKYNFVLDGNPIGLADSPTNGLIAMLDVESGDSQSATINCALVLATNTQSHFSVQPGCGVSATLRLNADVGVNGGYLQLACSPGANCSSDGTRQIQWAGSLSGTGSVILRADGPPFGTIVFSGTTDNTFAGDIWVEPLIGGVLWPAMGVSFDKAAGVVMSNRLFIIDGAVVSFQHSNQLDPNASVHLIDGGALLLNGNNQTIFALGLTNTSFESFAPASTVDTGGGLLGLNGRLSSLNDNTNVIPIIRGNLNLNGYLQFDINGSAGTGLEIAANIQGNGFYKTGKALLRLGGTNSYWGDTEVRSGTIEAAATSVNAFGQSGSPSFGVHLEGGNIVLQSVSIGFSPLFVSALSQGNSMLFSYGPCFWYQPIQLDTNLNIIVDSGQSLTLVGAISGSGGLNLFGAGAVVMEGGNNSFTGPTTVNCSLLQLAKGPGFVALAGPLIVGYAGGASGCEVRWSNSYIATGILLTLYANGRINLNNNNEDFHEVTFNGGEVDTGTGQFGMYAPITVNPAPTSAVINGYLGLPPGGDRVFIVGAGGSTCDLMVNAVVFGNAPHLVKQGPGTMCVSAANTYAGVTLLEGGVLDLFNASALGSAGCVIFSGATLRFETVGVVPNSFEMVGAGDGGTHGAVEVLPGWSVSLQGNILLDAATTLNVGNSGFLYVNGVVSGTGPLIKTGTGTVWFGSGVNNTYSGDTIVSDGTLLLPRSPSVVAVPGNLVVGPAPAGHSALAQLQQFGNLGGSTVTVNANGLFDLNGFNQTLAQLNLNDGGSVQTGTGTLGFSSGGQVNISSLDPRGSHKGSVITGNLAIAPNDVINFNVAPYAIFSPFDLNPELNVLATIPKPAEQISFAPAGITKGGTGRMRLGGTNTYAGYTQVNGGTLQVDGTQPSSPAQVNAGATLSGAGTVGAVFLTGGTSVVRPGDHPGILNCGSFNRFGSGSGALQIELNGPAAGQYDQLIASGLISLAGVILNSSLNYASSPGDQFVILKNNSGSPVSGTFTGLSQNAQFHVGGQLFQINYSGGAGNDVVLSRLVTPPLPVLTIQKLPPASVRLSWPTNPPHFLLQYSTDLATNSWAPATNASVVVGTNNVVTNPVTGVSQFYRLAAP